MNTDPLPHFAEDYRTLVRNLRGANAHSDAMEAAVGGGYKIMGAIEAQVLRRFGLKTPISLLDFGCGSGQLAAALAADGTLDSLTYTGIDVVQDLLSYANQKVNEAMPYRTGDVPDFRFKLSTSLTIPMLPRSCDMICAFSVFTHLHQAEIFVYLAEFHRILREGGTAIISYQDIGSHWKIFEDTVHAHKAHGKPWPHMNMFVSNDQLQVMADRVGFIVSDTIDGGKELWEVDGKNYALGQHIMVLRKRSP